MHFQISSHIVKNKSANKTKYFQSGVISHKSDLPFMDNTFTIPANSRGHDLTFPAPYHILCLYVSIIAFGLSATMKTNRQGWIIKDNNGSQP